MAEYELLIKPSAVKEIERIDGKKDRQKMVLRIEGLADEPRPVGCEKLTDQERYRLRQGSYRILYTVDDEQRTVLIVKVGHRQDVFR